MPDRDRHARDDNRIVPAKDDRRGADADQDHAISADRRAGMSDERRTPRAYRRSIDRLTEPMPTP